MDNIDYSWDDNDKAENIEITADSPSKKPAKKENISTRHHIQIMRRLFHMFNGFAIATLYLVSFDHSQMVHFLGTVACVLYLVEQVRVNYPETAAKLIPVTRFIIRAEEQLKESAMVPYAMAVLLTIVVFPKHIALIGIYSLAFADPLSAIIGIKFGKHKISPTRSVEGSLAFFVSVFLVSIFILTGYNEQFEISILLVSALLGLICAGFDLIPLKLDDNLTIPLFTSASLWIVCTLFGIYI
ncbi:MAG: phosphatidate cytidylyltransferase [Halobacteriovoraceae bacterium]|jgi:diacylglycerol kinase (CTP)|nr:phosphatidate cytidylyltransferase [Halobacteriovoraceae bacterium]